MKVYIKFISLIFLKSLLYVIAIMFSLIFILNLLTELEFFKGIQVSIGFPCTSFIAKRTFNDFRNAPFYILNNNSIIFY